MDISCISFCAIMRQYSSVELAVHAWNALRKIFRRFHQGSYSIRYVKVIHGTTTSSSSPPLRFSESELGLFASFHKILCNRTSCENLGMLSFCQHSFSHGYRFLFHDCIIGGVECRSFCGPHNATFYHSKLPNYSLEIGSWGTPHYMFFFIGTTVWDKFSTSIGSSCKHREQRTLRNWPGKHNWLLNRLEVYPRFRFKGFLGCVNPTCPDCPVRLMLHIGLWYLYVFSYACWI